MDDESVDRSNDVRQSVENEFIMKQLISILKFFDFSDPYGK